MGHRQKHWIVFDGWFCFHHFHDRLILFQRIIHSFVAGRPILRKGYNLIAFLEDFLKYYNKGPNFARDALATGIINLTTGSNVASTQVRQALCSSVAYLIKHLMIVIYDSIAVLTFYDSVFVIGHSIKYSDSNSSLLDVESPHHH